ncbi:unnamed protein product [Lampetra planeri]
MRRSARSPLYAPHKPIPPLRLHAGRPLGNDVPFPRLSLLGATCPAAKPHSLLLTLWTTSLVARCSGDGDGGGGGGGGGGGISRFGHDGPAGHRCASPNRFPDGGRANKTAATSGGQSGPGRSSRTEAPRPPCPERAAGMARSKPPDRSDDGPRGARGTDMRKDEPGSYPAAALCKIRQKFRKDGTVVVLLLS